MVVQLPLQLVSKYFENTRVGNMIMWVSLFLGQPLLEVWISYLFIYLNI